ncbi:hypothetical protein GCM10009426_28390 [Rheinheimera tangshanensis]|nr:hypothetical protein GCM10010920_30340 [Rheinheimera tangshanensis]
MCVSMACWPRQTHEYLMEINDMNELNLNELSDVNGGAVVAIPLAYKVFVAGFTAGSGLVIAAYKML